MYSMTLKMTIDCKQNLTQSGSIRSIWWNPEDGAAEQSEEHCGYKNKSHMERHLAFKCQTKDDVTICWRVDWIHHYSSYGFVTRYIPFCTWDILVQIHTLITTIEF